MPPVSEIEDVISEEFLFYLLLKGFGNVGEMLQILPSEDAFTAQWTITLYKAFKSLHGQGKRISSYSIGIECKAIAEPPQTTTWHGIISGLRQSDTNQPIAEVMKFIYELWKRRIAAQVFWELTNQIVRPEVDADAIFQKARRELEAFANNHTGLQRRSISTIADEWLDERIAVQEGKAEAGLLVGIAAIDAVFSGFVPGEVVVIAARPSMGKTAFACQLMYNLSIRKQVPGAFFSLEMLDKGIFQRLMCIESGYSNTEFKKMDTVDTELVRRLTGKLKASPLTIGDGRMSISTIEMKVRQLVESEKIKYLVIDYVGLIDGDDRNNSNRVQEVSNITRRIKVLANQHQIVIFLLSQLNRSVEARENKRPKMSDLRDSGSVEQDADDILLLFRPSYYETAMAGDEDLLEIHVKKSRNGRTTEDNAPVTTTYTRDNNRIWDWGYPSPFNEPNRIQPSVYQLNSSRDYSDDF